MPYSYLPQFCEVLGLTFILFFVVGGVVAKNQASTDQICMEGTKQKTEVFFILMKEASCL